MNKGITHIFFNLLINYCFCFHRFTFFEHVLLLHLITCGDNDNYINLDIIMLRNFWNYNGSSVCLRMKHVLDFCLSRTIQCMLFITRTNNAWISQGYYSWYNMCVVNSITCSTILVGTTCTIASSLFLLRQISLA